MWKEYLAICIQRRLRRGHPFSMKVNTLRRLLQWGIGGTDTSVLCEKSPLGVQFGTQTLRLVRCQSIRQRPPAMETQNSCFSGVARAW